MESRLGQGGPVMFTYFNFQGDPNQTFTQRSESRSQKPMPEVDGLYVRKTRIQMRLGHLSGSPDELGERGKALHPRRAKGEPTAKSRALFVFETFDSPNNVVELQMG